MNAKWAYAPTRSPIGEAAVAHCHPATDPEGMGQVRDLIPLTRRRSAPQQDGIADVTGPRELNRGGRELFVGGCR